MAPPQGAKEVTMAHRAPKINDTVKFTDRQQAILNDAVEQLMEVGGLMALTKAHFNEAMKIVAQHLPTILQIV